MNGNTDSAAPDQTASAAEPGLYGKADSSAPDQAASAPETE